jgi:hypothetical protein
MILCNALFRSRVKEMLVYFVPFMRKVFLVS